MSKEANLHWEKGKVNDISEADNLLESKAKPKNKVGKGLKDPSKRINDYFPVVPKGNQETKEDSGVESKEAESKITEHTTPDKSVSASANSKPKEVVKGK